MSYNAGSFILSLEEYSENPDNQAIVSLDEGGYTSLDVLYACMTGLVLEPTLPGMVPALIESELPKKLSELESLRVKNALKAVYKNIRKEFRKDFSKKVEDSAIEISEDDLLY
ncbi:hypothetical protein COB11_01715 [Candidatus Aerophobetes bacterium]|uniref:Uncharacterized protein n=1 Tax=Aerophobetes bacterium TaxID=2030807 RepID=A0A2A4YMT0_UNCAE|nr:MAG: hypothetical protein COB11_01715 [Candidatus Aerophobetes bacterium]